MIFMSSLVQDNLLYLAPQGSIIQALFRIFFQNLIPVFV